MRTYEALMDEVAAALQFPPYFGENWAALDECLSDMDWWPAWPRAMVIVILDAEGALAKDKRDLEAFARILAKAVVDYAAPVSEGEFWDRAAIPMRVVLSSTDPDKAEKRWSAAGATIERLA